MKDDLQVIVLEFTNAVTHMRSLQKLSPWTKSPTQTSTKADHTAISNENESHINRAYASKRLAKGVYVLAEM